jgi:hypothetical protein
VAPEWLGWEVAESWQEGGRKVAHTRVTSEWHQSGMHQSGIRVVAPHLLHLRQPLLLRLLRLLLLLVLHLLLVSLVLLLLLRWRRGRLGEARRSSSSSVSVSCEQQRQL